MSTILVQGAGGARFLLDPETPWVADQLRTGQLVAVEGEGSGSAAGGQTAASPTSGAGAPAPDRPARSDAKADWVDYIAATTDLTEAEASDMTKAELQELAEQ